MERTNSTEHPVEQPVYPPRHPRRPAVLGLVGTALGAVCPPAGLGLGIASLVFVRRDGGRYLWGIGAVSVSIAAAVVGTVLLVAG